jgi:mannose-1-phosphate guanylyltransferase
MKALILAAGLGTRLHPYTLDRPKPMLPIGGQPLLKHTVGLLRSHGIREIAINLHHHPEVVIRQFGDGRDIGVRIVYSIEDTLLGTAGAAKKLAGFLDEPFCVFYGDVLTDLDVSALAAWHRARRAALSLSLYRVEDPTRASVVDLDPAGRILRFREKPLSAEAWSNLANAGVLIAEPTILEQIPGDTFYDFGDHLIPRLLQCQMPMYGRLADGYVLDIGSPERYLQAQTDVQAGRVRLRGHVGTSALSQQPEPDMSLDHDRC